jgi:uncharacterized protein
MFFLVITGFSATLLAPSPPPATPQTIPTMPSPVAQPVKISEPKQLPPIVSIPSPIVQVPAVVEAPNPPVLNPALPTAVEKGGKPKIALLITELGEQPALTREAIAKLPRQIGLGFSPFGTLNGSLLDAARASGHEIWVGVPMQPKRYPQIDPGKNALLLGVGDAENVRRFEWALSQVPGSKTGFYNMMGSAFTAKAAALKPIMAAATLKQLAYVDTRSGMDTVGPDAASRAKVRTVLSRGYLDEPASDLAKRLDSLVEIARKEGEVTAMVSLSPAAIAAVTAWANQTEAAGIELVTPGQLSR